MDRQIFGAAIPPQSLLTALELWVLQEITDAVSKIGCIIEGDEATSEVAATAVISLGGDNVVSLACAMASEMPKQLWVLAPATLRWHTRPEIRIIPGNLLLFKGYMRFSACRVSEMQAQLCE